MKEQKNFVCISCPMGCRLTVEKCGNNIKVSGNTCKLGEKYAINEYTNPVRTITTSIKVKTNSGIKMISVKTNKEVPKSSIFDCIEEIKKLVPIQSEIKCGDVLIKNILNLGVDIVATREMKLN